MFIEITFIKNQHWRIKTNYKKKRKNGRKEGDLESVPEKTCSMIMDSPKMMMNKKKHKNKKSKL